MSELGKSLLKGAEEALEYAKGHKKGSRTHKVKVPAQVNVHRIRSHLHMTRKEFSDEFGFSVRTLEKWERGERVPEGPTRAYLTVIEKKPSCCQESFIKIRLRYGSASTAGRPWWRPPPPRIQFTKGDNFYNHTLFFEFRREFNLQVQQSYDRLTY